NQYTNIRLISLEYKVIFTMNSIVCIYAGHKALSCGFLITCSSVYLSGEIKICNELCFQGMVKLGRREVVIFYCVSRPENLYIFKSRYMSHGFDLNIFR